MEITSWQTKSFLLHLFHIFIYRSHETGIFFLNMADKELLCSKSSEYITSSKIQNTLYIVFLNKISDLETNVQNVLYSITTEESVSFFFVII